MLFLYNLMKQYKMYTAKLPIWQCAYMSHNMYKNSCQALTHG